MARLKGLEHLDLRLLDVIYKMLPKVRFLDVAPSFSSQVHHSTHLQDRVSDKLRGFNGFLTQLAKDEDFKTGSKLRCHGAHQSPAERGHTLSRPAF